MIIFWKLKLCIGLYGDSRNEIWRKGFGFVWCIYILLSLHQFELCIVIQSSAYIKPFEEEMKEWEDKLLSMQDILDAWLRCQESWLYLEPIFNSEDIMKQMPVEGRKFNKVCDWKKDASEYSEKNWIQGPSLQFQFIQYLYTRLIVFGVTLWRKQLLIHMSFKQQINQICYRI